MRQPLTGLQRQQRGAALLVTLVMLLVMTVLGTHSMQGSTMQQNMATKMEDRNRAFQSAERALREAESHIQSLLDSTTGLDRFGVTNGLYRALEDSEGECISHSNWRSSVASWDADDSFEVNIRSVTPFSQMGLRANPRYMIGLDTETDPLSVCYSSTVADGYSDSASGAGANIDVLRFTITAIGYGKGEGSKVVLQETWSVSL